LKGSAVARGFTDILIETVLFGRATMPAFRMSLDDAGLAMILSYVRNAWGNDMQDVVQASRVAALRSGKDREVSD
jgi:mono/diheme cytochrome c family protein